MDLVFPSNTCLFLTTFFPILIAVWGFSV